MQKHAKFYACNALLLTWRDACSFISRAEAWNLTCGPYHVTVKGRNLRVRTTVWLGTVFHWGAFHQAFCQCFSLTNFISYWNPCIWLAESKFVSEKHWQNAWWNAPQRRYYPAPMAPMHPPLPNGHRRRSRGDGGGGGRVPPRIFLGGSSPPPSIFESLKNIYSYICILNTMKGNTKRLIQRKNTTKHTKSLNFPRALRADSRPNHISASLALPAISVAGGGGGEGRGAIPPPPPPIMLFQSIVGTFRNLSLQFVSRQTCHLYRQSIWSTNKILKEIAVIECKNARKFSKLARIYIDFLNVSVLSVYITVVYIQRHTMA